MAHSVLLTGPDRRRSWSDVERWEILAQASRAGRDRRCRGAAARDVERAPLHLASQCAARKGRSISARSSPAISSLRKQRKILSELIVIRFPGRTRVSISATASADLIAAALRGLR